MIPPIIGMTESYTHAKRELVCESFRRITTQGSVVFSINGNVNQAIIEEIGPINGINDLRPESGPVDRVYFIPL